ncbi:MAG: hypothetical protein HY318_04470, partial [Armatimonadetes bacterium]|nr:hypothetical protein [Armatimonadota bacterium]
PSGDQVKAQEASSGLKSTFQVKVQNDGSSARSYIVKAEESSESGWTIAYKVGSSDVTSQITSSSGRKTGGLAAGGKEVMTIEMTPGSSATGSNATKSVTIKVYNEASDTTVRDSVKAITSASSSALRASALETDSQEDSVQGDLTLASVTASPNPVKVGGVVNFQYVVSNVGDRTEKNVTVRLTANGRVLGSSTISSLAPGASCTGTIQAHVAADSQPGSVYVTAEVSPVTGEVKTSDNRATVKLTVE